jgi:hypothetical protein
MSKELRCGICGVRENEECELMTTIIEEGQKKTYCCTHLLKERNKKI